MIAAGGPLCDLSPLGASRRSVFRFYDAAPPLPIGHAPPNPIRPLFAGPPPFKLLTTMHFMGAPTLSPEDGMLRLFKKVIKDGVPRRAAPSSASAVVTSEAQTQGPVLPVGARQSKKAFSDLASPPQGSPPLAALLHEAAGAASTGPKPPLPMPHKAKLNPAPRLRPKRLLPRVRPEEKLLTARQLADLVQAILSANGANAVGRLLDQVSRKLSRASLALVLGELGRAGALARALEVLAWMQQAAPPKLKPDQRAYYTLIWTMLEAGQVPLAQRLHAHMAQMGCPRSAGTEKALVLAFAAAGHCRGAVGGLRRSSRPGEGEGEGRGSEAALYVALIEQASKAGRPRGVRTLLREMSARLPRTAQEGGGSADRAPAGGEEDSSSLEGAPHGDTWHEAQQGCGSAGRASNGGGAGGEEAAAYRGQGGAVAGVQEAGSGRVQDQQVGLRGPPHEERPEPAVVPPGALGREEVGRLLAACTKVGLRNEAQALAAHLKEDGEGAAHSGGGRQGGGQAPLDVASWTAVISGHQKAGRLGEAAVEFWRMQRAGVEPDQVALGVLMQVYCQMGDAAKAADLVKQMRQAGRQPTLGDCTALIALHCQQGNASEAAEVLKAMALAGTAPTAATYNHLIRAHKVAGQPEAALAVARPMLRVGGPLTPNLETRCLLLEIYLGQGAHAKVREELQSMQEAGMAVPRAVADMLVAAYLEEGRAGELRQLLEGMAVGRSRAGGRTRGQRHRRMLRAQEETTAKKSVAHFNSLLDQCCSAGHLGKAPEVLQAMHSEGVSPTTETYNMLIRAHKDAGQAGVAVELAGLMRALGELPDARTHGLLLDLHLGSGDLDKAAEQLEALKGNHCRVSQSLLDRIGQAYTEAGRHAEIDALLAGT